MSFNWIPGWCNFEFLYDRMVASLPHGGQIVEVGAWLGRSTAYLASRSKKAQKSIQLSVVDTWEGSLQEDMYRPTLNSMHDSVFEAFRTNMIEAGVWEFMNAIRCESAEAALRFPNNSIDFVFIDAAHDFHSVVADIRAWWPKVKIGGWIGGHDFGMWNGVTRAVELSFQKFEAIPKATSWLVQKQADNELRRFPLPPKIGVVTPCYRPQPEIFMQCLQSVYQQTIPCVHYLIGDGETLRIPDRPLYTRVATIPGPHKDTGNAARAIGSTLAIAEGCDAIAFLDCDNWYSPGHLSTMLQACQKATASICSSARNLHAPDGTLIGRCPHVDGETFADTNCMFFLKPAFGLLSVWGRIPSRLKLIGDRVIWKEVLKSKFERTHSPLPTVAYRTMYREHYMIFGKEPPEGAKVLRAGPNGIELISDT